MFKIIKNMPCTFNFMLILFKMNLRNHKSVITQCEVFGLVGSFYGACRH